MALFPQKVAEPNPWIRSNENGIKSKTTLIKFFRHRKCQIIGSRFTCRSSEKRKNGCRYGEPKPNIGIREGGKRWVRSRIIRPQESLALYKSFRIVLSGWYYHHSIVIPVALARTCGNIYFDNRNISELNDRPLLRKPDHMAEGGLWLQVSQPGIRDGHPGPGKFNLCFPVTEWVGTVWKISVIAHESALYMNVKNKFPGPGPRIRNPELRIQIWILLEHFCIHWKKYLVKYR